MQLAPSPDSRIVTDPQTNVSSLSYAFADNFENGATTIDPGSFLEGRFIEHLVNGTEGKSLKSLLHPETMIQAIDRFYRKFMVHVIDMDYRLPLNGFESGTTRQLQYLQPAADDGRVRGRSEQIVSRLKMSEASKIALEALLGTMVVLGGLAYWLVDVRGTLPRNPFPIASGMALFEGSRFLDALEESEGRSDREETPYDGLDEEVRNSSLTAGRSLASGAEGKRFRLGWWDDGRVVEGMDAMARAQSVMVGRRFGIDIVTEDDEMRGIMIDLHISPAGTRLGRTSCSIQ